MRNDTFVVTNTTYNLLDSYARPLLHDAMTCDMWMCDFVHYSGNAKPWLRGPPANWRKLKPPFVTATHLWYYTLLELDATHDLGINFTHWSVGKPPLGAWAAGGQVVPHVQRSLH